MRFLLAPLALVLFVFAVGLRPAQQGVPPDIQKLIDKQASGQKLTSAEMQKLLDYASRLANKAATGRVNLDPKLAIPVEIEAWGEYTSEDEGGYKEKFDYKVTTKALLYTRINGTEDYGKAIADPDAKSSSFLIMPEQVGATSRVNGHGSFTKEAGTKDEQVTTKADVSDIAFGLELITTGSDRLYPLGRALQGVFKGSVQTRRGGETETEKLEASGGLYERVNFPFPYESQIEWDPTQPTPKKFMLQASYADLVQAVKAPGPATVTLKESFDLSDFGDTVKGTSTVVIRLRPTEKPELNIAIDKYDSWRPEGQIDESRNGNILFLKAELNNADGSPLTDVQKAQEITFKLTNTSKEPGICLNWPETTDPNASCDMVFDPGMNTKAKVSTDGQILTTKNAGLAKFTAVLSSRDFGAWSTLEVTAQTGKGMVTGHLATDQSMTSILLPKREKNSHIAEAWLKAKAVSSQDDGSDEEAIPKGDGDKGDGYTLYEEYRGFMEAGKHIDADPAKKDLMILNALPERLVGKSVKVTVRHRGEESIQLFAGSSGLVTHSKFTPEEFGNKQEAAMKAGTDYERDKRMNRHHRDGAHLADQHGVVITESASGGSAMAVWKVAGTMGTPHRYKYITISSSFDPDPTAWHHTNTGGAKTLTDYYAVSVAHEILHCCNVKHHGESDYDGVLSPEYDPGGAGKGKDWTKFEVLKSDGTVYSTHKVELWEDGVAGKKISEMDPRWQKWGYTLKVKVGAPQGQHSGVEDCIMRYDNADAYVIGNRVYVMEKPAGVVPELSGITLCTTDQGTGCNAPDFKPRPRYGNAAPGRGKCRDQLCVNDRYH
jgi:hypothetical protein